MSTNILDHLPQLRPHSNIQLVNTVPAMFKSKIQQKGKHALELVEPTRIANAHWASTPYKGAQSLMQLDNRQAIRKVMTLQPGFGGNLTYQLNTSLLGGESYPVLTAILGTAAGMVSAGGGLLFAAFTTSITAAHKQQRVLARGGDEIWQVEEIGKVKDGSGYQAMHVNSYFLVDPYRRQVLEKGWIVHEDRTEILLN